MKPANFFYHRPRRLEEALNLLEKFGDKAKLIAGGQSLVPMMNMRLVRPEHLIDLNDLTDLSYIRKSDNGLQIGALTRQSELERSPILQQYCPILPAAVHYIGHYVIRQRGTIGGSVVHADPSAELPLLAVLLDANLTIASADGIRQVSAREFFISIYTTDLQPHEILMELEFPVLTPNMGWSFQEFSRRAGDFALVSAASVISLDAAGRVKELRLALGGADAIPLSVATKLESYLGERPDVSWQRAVTAAALEGLEPTSDIHASSDDRMDWLELMIERALNEAISRALTGSQTTRVGAEAQMLNGTEGGGAQ